MRWLVGISVCAMVVTSIVRPTLGNALTNGPNGINVPAGLTGTGIGLGQVEPGRPGLPGFDPPDRVHTSVVPTAVFRRDGMPNLADVDGHAEQVAGIMISTDATLRGVAPAASLYASAYVTTGIDPGYQHALLSLQNVATQPNVWAVNHSWESPIQERSLTVILS